jgi:hypothetical protein
MTLVDTHGCCAESYAVLDLVIVAQLHDTIPQLGVF